MKALLHHDKLHKLGAILAVDHINHREFLYKGYRYFCGWDSTIDPKAKLRKYEEYRVKGWITYKVIKEKRKEDRRSK